MIYVIQSILYATVMWLLYLLLLKNRPLHRFNRFYLLSASLLPLMIPFVKLELLASKESLITRYLSFRLPEVSISDNTATVDVNSVATWVLSGYLIVTLALSAYTFYQWFALKRLIKISAVIKAEGYTLVLHTGFGPASWHNYIFLPEERVDDRILAHEHAHIRLQHTKDLVLLTVLQCIYWCNPFIHIIKKELKLVHEFEADDAVKTDKTSYQELLLHYFLKTCHLPFTHSFIHHPIKRRIMMLNKTIKPFSKKLVIFSAATLIFGFIANVVWFQSNEAKAWEFQKATTSDDSVFNFVKKMPEPTVNIAEFIGSNLKYPEVAKKNKIEGRVIVKFVVNQQGQVVHALVLKSPDEHLSKAALEVINKMPDWIPGENEAGEKVKVYFTQPIQFSLGPDNKKDKGTEQIEDKSGFKKQ